jgi:membrane protein required for colicin V production
MTLFDVLVLAVLILSTLLGWFRGLVREVVSLLSWVIAFFAAKAWADDFGIFLPQAVENENLRWILGFVLVFAIVLVLLALASRLAGEMLRSVGLKSLDQGLGAAFGLMRGVFIVTVVALLAGMSDLPKSKVWRDARLSQPVETMARLARLFLPEELAQRIRY